MWFRSSHRRSRDFPEPGMPAPRVVVHQHALPEQRHQDFHRRRSDLTDSDYSTCSDDYSYTPRRSTKFKRHEDYRRDTDPNLPLPRAHQRTHARPNRNRPRNPFASDYCLPNEPPPPYEEFAYKPQRSSKLRGNDYSNTAQPCSTPVCTRDALGGTDYCEFHIFERSEASDDERPAPQVHIHMNVHVHASPLRRRPTPFAAYAEQLRRSYATYPSA